MKNHPLVFLQLNEINFDLVKRYVEKFNDLPNFKKLISEYKCFETFAEREYNELEPWIQWVSVQTGKTYAEHGVFHLGDIVKKPDSLLQIFEVLEDNGLRVGVVSAMNARNKLREPAYFIPDPWTDTFPDDDGFSRRLTDMLRQTVNDNATGKISIFSLAVIFEAVVRSFSLYRTIDLIKIIGLSRGRPWFKSLVLDQLIHLVHRRLLLKKNPDVSFVFFNAGAHIQHHYLFNTKVGDKNLSNPSWYVDQKADPVHDMLRIYDVILGDYMALVSDGARLMVATGLTQVPYNRVKYYYRLKNHEDFLRCIGVSFVRVLPRMTRDFEITFNNNIDRDRAVKILNSAYVRRGGVSIFEEIESSDSSIFVTLTYPEEIIPGDMAVYDGGEVKDFSGHVAFVAIKNGMHSSKGFAFVSPNYLGVVPSGSVYIGGLFGLTKDLSGVSAP